MKHCRISVIFYSATGHSRALADEIAAELGASTAQITCPSLDRRRFAMLIRLWSAFTRSRPMIRLEDSGQQEALDLVVLGAPVWIGRLATPMLSYLDGKTLPNAKAYALFLCAGSEETEGAIKQFAAMLPRPPVATLSVSDADRIEGRHIAKAQDFAETLKGKLLRCEPARKD